MTQYPASPLDQRIEAHLAQLRDMLGDHLDAGLAVTHAGQLASVFYRLSRDLSTLGALAWNQQHRAFVQPTTHEPPALAPAPAAPAPPAPSPEPAASVAPAPSAVAPTPKAAPPAGAPIAPKASVSDSALKRLQQQMMSNQVARSPQDGPDLVAQARERARITGDLVTLLGKSPTNLRGATPVLREWDRLRRFDDHHVDLLQKLEKKTIHAILSWMAARMRALQDASHWPPLPTADTEIAALVRRLADCSRDTQCGMVHGLARAHDSRRDTWLADAQACEEPLAEWLPAPAARKSDPAPVDDTPANLDDRLRRLRERVQQEEVTSDDFIGEARALIEAGLPPTHTSLVNLARDFVPDLYDQLGLSRLRKAVEEVLADEIERESEGPLDDEWAGFAWSTGKRVAMVGGDPRSERVAPIKAAFRLAELEWVHVADNSGTRRLDTLEEQLRNGKYDAVFVLSQYCSHKISDRVFARKREVDVLLSSTYGIKSLAQAIEKYMAHRGVGQNH